MKQILSKERKETLKAKMAKISTTAMIISSQMALTAFAADGDGGIVDFFVDKFKNGASKIIIIAAAASGIAGVVELLVGAYKTIEAGSQEHSNGTGKKDFIAGILFILFCIFIGSFCSSAVADMIDKTKSLLS